MEKIGQLFVLGFKGTFPSKKFISLLKDFQIGGVILFSENVSSSKNLKETISYLQSQVKIPLFIMIDQEGGKVNRIKKGLPLFPSNRYFGEKNDPKEVYKAYKTTADALFEWGINVNLAPVVDVWTNPQNKVIKKRSFGKEPEKVAKLSAYVIKGIKAGKIFSCAKHFPGLGDAEIDPHFNLAVNTNPKERFEKNDFVPFKRAIKENVDLVMTTHILCPKLDQEFPATLSKKIINILRKELGFKNLVITDDMEMGGMEKNFNITDACEKAFLSGHNLILICHNWDKQIKILKHFAKMYQEDEKF